MAEIREGLLYTDTHMWIRQADGKVYIGMTDHAQDDLGDVVFVDLPKEGTDVRKGDEIGALESVKTVEPLYSPVTGKIVGSNKILSDTPETINESPYDDGWIFSVELSDPSELNGLLDPKGYSELN